MGHLDVIWAPVIVPRILRIARIRNRTSSMSYNMFFMMFVTNYILLWYGTIYFSRGRKECHIVWLQLMSTALLLFPRPQDWLCDVMREVWDLRDCRRSKQRILNGRSSSKTPRRTHRSRPSRRNRLFSRLNHLDDLYIEINIFFAGPSYIYSTYIHIICIVPCSDRYKLCH